jgi:hypothetical protein
VAVSVLSVDGLMRLSTLIRDTDTGASQRRSFGAQSVPSLALGLTYGTGNNKANKLYCAKRTLAATTFDLIDLAGGLSDGIGNTLTFTKIKLCLVAIVSPASTKSLRVGPQNQSNPYLGAWGGTGATVYQTINQWGIVDYEPLTGHTVTAGTGDILPIYNPGAGSLDYWLLIAGV